jgi:hypothetical protein
LPSRARTLSFALSPWIALSLFACSPSEPPVDESGTVTPGATSPETPTRRSEERKETPKQLSYRMLPVLEPSAPQAEDVSSGAAAPAYLETAAPLLQLPESLPLRTQLILRKLGDNRPPSPEELRAMEGLGKSLSELSARNLRELLRRLVEGGDVTAIGGSRDAAQLLRVDPSHFGVHSLILIPEFWDTCERLLGGPAWVIAPTRSIVLGRAPGQHGRTANRCRARRSALLEGLPADPRRSDRAQRRDPGARTSVLRGAGPGRQTRGEAGAPGQGRGRRRRALTGGRRPAPRPFGIAARRHIRPSI